MFERKKMDPKSACEKAMKLLGECEKAVSMDVEICTSRSDVRDRDQRWKAPYATPFKLNTDAAMKQGVYAVGYVLMSAGVRKMATWEVDMAEVAAIKFGMQYAFDA